MHELLTINSDTQTVSARSLYEAVGSSERFNAWFERQLQYGFVEGEDFTGCKTFNTLAHQELQDYNISIDMAKEICMVQKNEKAREVRKYLIDLEKAWNTPEQLMARALRVADETINNLRIEVSAMKPKADYFDALVDKKLNTSFRDTAKELGIKPKDFIGWLKNGKYIFKGNDGNYRPYSQYSEHDKGYFTIKEVKLDNGYATVQTLVTPKGRATFNMLINQMYLPLS